MRRRDSWRAILAARTDVDRMVASAVGDYPDKTPVRPSDTAATLPYATAVKSGLPFAEPAWRDPGASRTGDTQVTAMPTQGPTRGPTHGTEASARSPALTDDERRILQELHGRVDARVAKLYQELAHEEGRDLAITALVLYLDERIMDRLPDYLRLGWPLLQAKRLGSSTGGDDFYRFANELVAAPNTPSFVLEVYYFCLEQGFVGRYANDLVSIEEHKQRLRGAIDLPRVASETPDTAEVSTEVGSPVPASMAYAASLAVVVVITAGLTLLSNY